MTLIERVFQEAKNRPLSLKTLLNDPSICGILKEAEIKEDLNKLVKSGKLNTKTIDIDIAPDGNDNDAIHEINVLYWSSNDPVKESHKPDLSEIHVRKQQRVSSIANLPTRSPLLEHNKQPEGLPQPTPEVLALKDRKANLEKEVEELKATCNPDEDIEQFIQSHIKRLHDYNEIKDIGQMLLGKCAEREQTTTKDMYEKFGLDLED